MSSSTSSFERGVPPVRWRLAATLALCLVATFVVLWELHCRRAGYAPTVNDTNELWASRRRAVKPDSVVIIGDSRAWFDINLDEFEKGFGRRPVQLAMAGSSPHPVLQDLAQDPGFHGTLVCSVVPALFFAPPGSPPMNKPSEAVAHFHRMPMSELLGLPLSITLEQRLAFMNMQELTLEEMLKTLPLADRAGVQHPPALPPYFSAMDADRQARMIDRCIQPGPLQDRVKFGWLPLFTPPPPPPGVTQEQAMAQFKQLFEHRMAETVAAVERIRGRGGKVVFVRFPFTGQLKELEDKLTPRQPTWDLLLKQTGVPGIHFEDHPELKEFDCPEWSHLTPADAIEFTRRLVPLLRKQVS